MTLEEETKDPPDEDIITIHSDTKLKARRLILLDRAFEVLTVARPFVQYATGELERRVTYADSCVELARELRVGMAEKSKPQKRFTRSILDPEE